MIQTLRWSISSSQDDIAFHCKSYKTRFALSMESVKPRVGVELPAFSAKKSIEMIPIHSCSPAWWYVHANVGDHTRGWRSPSTINTLAIHPCEQFSVLSETAQKFCSS